MNEELTYMTDAHQTVIRHLERRGIGLMEEIDFPPYRADCYLPEYHALVEIDGPQHSEKADRKRDRELSRVYSLYVFHIAAVEANQPNKWFPKLKVFLRYTRSTRDERYEESAMRTPWL